MYSVFYLSLIFLVLAVACSKTGSEGDQGPTGPRGFNSLVKVTAVSPGAVCSAGGKKIEVGTDANNNGTLDVTEIQDTFTVCNGVAGVNGTNGHLALVKITPMPVGSTECPTGGQKIESGLDLNDNANLENNEVIGQPKYIQNGLSTLTKITTEAAGANCATGGSKVQTGVDDNGNGTLEDAEVDHTSYICSGSNGAAGANGTNGHNALVKTTPSATCAGGFKVEFGVDLNDNNTLDANEIDNAQTKEICNGTNGHKTLIKTTPSTCATGGIKVEFGVDLNDNNTLDANEIDNAQTKEICNGKNMLARTITETAGANCSTGGVKLEYGLDANNDGVLDNNEVNPALTKYVCNGATGSQGPKGDPGTANVIYSDWINVSNSWRPKTDASSNVVELTSISPVTVPQLLPSILNTGTILVYFRSEITSSAPVYQLSYISQGSNGPVSYSFQASQDGLNFKITTTGIGYGLSIEDRNFIKQIRYILIPGGVKAARAITIDYSNYREVCKKYGITP